MILNDVAGLRTELEREEREVTEQDVIDVQFQLLLWREFGQVAK